MSFHNLRFSPPIEFGIHCEILRGNEVTRFRNGTEMINQAWQHPQRRFRLNTGVQPLTNLAPIIAFFEARGGSAHSFRFRDPSDFSTAQHGEEVDYLDQEIGFGDGIRTSFALHKAYGNADAHYLRPIKKPVLTSVKIAIDGRAQMRGQDFEIDPQSGEIIFAAPPETGAPITAGFLFDVETRFENETIALTHSHANAGRIDEITLLEVK